MDVHPPHEPVHTWRDAFIHLGIVTIGLFIALMLEGVVEYAHHRQLVREARENIRREIESNRQSIDKDVNSIGDEAARVNAGLKTMRYMREHPQAKGRSIIFQWAYSDLSDAAWQTARDTGALGFMPYAEVQRDASLYRMQDQVTVQMQSVALRQLDLLAPALAYDDFGKIPEPVYAAMLSNTASASLDLSTLKGLMQGLEQDYADTLKH